MTALFVPGRSDWLLFAHVAAAFVFFGAALTVIVVTTAAARARTESEGALLERLALRVDLLLLWPSLVILVGAVNAEPPAVDRRITLQEPVGA